MHNKQRLVFGYLALIPAVIVFAVFIVYPVFNTFYLSFCSYRTQTIRQGARFIGFANYVQMFGDDKMWTALKFTVLFTVISVVLESVLGMLCALIMNRQGKTRGLVCAMILIPWCIPTVVSGLMWNYIFAESYGVLNYLLQVMGLSSQPVRWLTDSRYAFLSILISDVWKTVPYMSLLMLSALKTVDSSYLEAAQIDGANKVQSFFKISMPCMKPIIIVAVMFRTIQSFRIYDLIRVLTNGGPQGKTTSLTIYTITQYTTYGNMGYGAALAVLTFIISMIIAVCFQDGVKSKLEV
ncbi:MAG: sugar ABC transporter permease [Clostridia bacterium]|nr:sugar ABC transporter permease [Clostridia bacterium]